jgi:peptidoglycan-N-acetylglucosamine deacetylase
MDRRTMLCGIAVAVLAAASRAPAARGFPTEKVPAPVGVLHAAARER